jgi:four helix bundle protein
VLPEHERYSLVDQIRRAVVSIPANLAEGRSRSHTAEFLQYTSMARGSLAELETLLNLVESLGYARAARLSKLRHDLHALSLSLTALYFSLRRKLRGPRAA